MGKAKFAGLADGPNFSHGLLFKDQPPEDGVQGLRIRGFIFEHTWPGFGEPAAALPCIKHLALESDRPGLRNHQLREVGVHPLNLGAVTSIEKCGSSWWVLWGLLGALTHGGAEPLPLKPPH